MIRVFGSVMAIAGVSLASMGGCSDQGDGSLNTGGSDGTGAGSGGVSNSGSGGGGGDAGAPPACPECASGLCLPSGECVDCLPDPDTCSPGHCGPDYVCDPGCSRGNDCASGECVAQNCERCVDDLECADGKVCGSGICADPCTDSSDCDMTCCSTRCVDTARDIANCGGCGVACAANQFCGSEGCTAATLSNLCKTPKASLVLNGIPTDDGAVAQMRKAIEEHCSPAPALRSVSQSTTDLINPATGQPVVGGGEILVLAGGAFGHMHVGYLEREKQAPIYSKQADGNMLEFRETGSDNVVMSAPYASVTASHDFFVIQIARDEKSGTASVLAYGFFDAGTRAASYYFANELMPALSSHGNTWYVFEWTDANGDKAPSSAEISLADSG